MFFLSYKYKEEIDIGVLSKDKESLVPLSEVFNILNETPPETMLDLVSQSNEALIKNIVTTLEKTEFSTISLNDVQICAPIIKPERNVFCLGKNYVDHVKELKGTVASDIPKYPIIFTKSPNTVIGQNGIIKNHSNVTQHIDYEVELALIIGKDGINIKPENAYDHIFGYTVANDISARNLQGQRGQWFKGKTLDTFCPMGPYIVHKSAIPFPVELDIKCTINGEVRQDSNTKNLIFDIPTIISDLSQGMELKAGDIILTGTPSGVGLGFDPPKFLKSGDVVESYIEHIGTLTNKVE